VFNTANRHLNLGKVWGRMLIKKKLVAEYPLQGCVLTWSVEILSSFTHPQVFSKFKPVCIFLLLNTKIFWRMLVTKPLTGAIDFHSIFFFLLWKSMAPVSVWLPTFFTISLCSAEEKFIQVWNNLRVSKWWQNFHFKVNYPFKAAFWSDRVM